MQYGTNPNRVPTIPRPSSRAPPRAIHSLERTAPPRNRYLRESRMRRFFLGTTLLAEDAATSGTGRYVFLCPICGDAWARLDSPGGPGTVLEWHGFRWPCREHGDEHHCGGSFLQPILWWDIGPADKLARLPPAVLAHEAAVHATWWESFRRLLLTEQST